MQDFTAAVGYFRQAAVQGYSADIDSIKVLDNKLTPEQRAQAGRLAEAFQKAQKS